MGKAPKTLYRAGSSEITLREVSGGPVVLGAQLHEACDRILHVMRTPS